MKRTSARALSCAVALTLAALSTGCEKPVVAEAGAPAVAGGLQFEVGSYDVRYLELTEGDETFEYPQPVLIIPLTITNQGEDAFNYNPSHNAPQMNEASTPLLYPDPGPEATLPPESKTPINGVLLSRGQLSGQITQAKSLAKGDSVKDLYLFEPPPEGTSDLILSIPPAWHRGKTPVLFRLKYTPKQPKGPKVYGEGEGIAFDGVTFTVTGTETAYIKTTDTAQGEGFSTKPLFKISFSIENGRDDAITYDPNHRAVAGAPGARLFSAAEGAHKRVQFGPTTTPEGQLTDKREVAAGKTIKDYVLFEQPGEDVESLMLEYPASLFDGKGVARVNLDYTFKKPKLPEELAKKDDKKKEGEGEEKKDK